jgi:hypothetical protein
MHCINIKIAEQIFEKYSDIKFNEKPSGGSRIVPSGRTDMTQLVVAFRSREFFKNIFFSKGNRNTRYPLYWSPGGSRTSLNGCGKYLHRDSIPGPQWRTQDFFGGVQQIQLRTEGREKGYLGTVAP